ncbi:phenylpyruvate tautomerase MIF-related protein [Maridesulfovibrio sp. FT414]|uniref:phenylpyruvate tautomerase MIF-related protein n=1 Tax=Maridesulfovibrio sp. FT414 TaxID=2979469 RepID=UPI003D802618
MPYVRVETNVEVGAKADEFVAKLSKVVSEAAGKPESYVMILFNDGLKMSFSGTLEPAALVTFKSLGLQEDRCAPIAERLCAFLARELRVHGKRVYIDFENLDGAMLGWDSRTFG